MKFNVRTPMACIVAVLLAGQLNAAGIVLTGAEKIEGNGTAINLLQGGLAEGVDAYTDRDHKLVNIPDGLIGSDLLQVSNSDKSSVPYELSVSTNLGALYIGLDDRVGTQPLPWMDDTAFTGLPAGFVDTGAQIDIDEGNDGDVDQTFSMWVALAPPGTYSLGALDSGNNNYIVAGSWKIVPEPSSLALIGLGMLGVIGTTRRRSK